MSTVAGALLVLIALIDVFQTLLRPSATGRLTHLIFRGAWAVARRRPRARVASGALTVLLTIGLWVVLIAVGWALVYLPHVPDGFAYSGVDPDRYLPFFEALTFSLVALTTLALGDAVPTDPFIRVLSPLEALTGFALLSASVSWFMQLYPALARRRALAIELTGLHEAGLTRELAAIGPAAARDTVRWVTQSLAALTADLVQNTEIFYFAERDARLSAARARARRIPRGGPGPRRDQLRPPRRPLTPASADRRRPAATPRGQACRRRRADTTSSCQRRAAGRAPVKIGVSCVTPWYRTTLASTPARRSAAP